MISEAKGHDGINCTNIIQCNKKFRGEIMFEGGKVNVLSHLTS